MFLKNFTRILYIKIFYSRCILLKFCILKILLEFCLWTWFGLKFEILLTSNTIRACLAAWWCTTASNPYVAFRLHVTPLFIAWHTWRFRNLVVFEGVMPSLSALCAAVFRLGFNNVSFDAWSCLAFLLPFY